MEIRDLKDAEEKAGKRSDGSYYTYDAKKIAEGYIQRAKQERTGRYDEWPFFICAIVIGYVTMVYATSLSQMAGATMILWGLRVSLKTK